MGEMDLGGALCIAIELFVTPGTGVFGVGGGTLIIVSVVLASQTFIIPRNTYQLEQLPYSLATVLAGGGNCHQAAINVSGSETEWDGLLAAPNGLLQVNGAKSRGGQILALSIQISGSDLRFR